MSPTAGSPRGRASLLGGPPIGTLEAMGHGPGVLGLHGFGATPQEVDLVIEIARELGLAARAPLLPGHGTSVLDLARTRYRHWLGAAERALFALAAEHQQVIVIGSSMGSLLALDLAVDYPDVVVGVGVLGSPIRLPWPYPSLALAAIDWLGIPDFTLPKSGPDILDPEGRRTQVTYSEQPAHAGNEVRRAGRRVEGRIGLVSCPAFVAHGRHDRVCPVANARIVHDRLATPAAEKELLILERSHHIITRDLERGILHTRLRAFIERVSARVERAPSSASDAGGPVSTRRAIGFG
ncbi:MAG TPA: alpha/beta fold hydrolase [Polyangiaceae bacterium]|nr:alpha/beta fold hydrolase [Polyangiaceae bacterium]